MISLRVNALVNQMNGFKNSSQGFAPANKPCQGFWNLGQRPSYIMINQFQSLAFYKGIKKILSSMTAKCNVALLIYIMIIRLDKNYRQV